MELLKTHTDFKTCLILSIELAELTRLSGISVVQEQSHSGCVAPLRHQQQAACSGVGLMLKRVPQQGSLDLCEELTLSQRREQGGQ